MFVTFFALSIYKNYTASVLNRIHKCLLDAIEGDTPQNSRHQHNTETTQQVVDVHSARAQESVAKRIGAIGLAWMIHW